MPLKFYLYDAAGVTGGSALIYSTNQPEIGYVRIQGAIPTSATGRFAMGSFGFNSSAFDTEFNSGAVTIAALGTATGYQDAARQNSVIWGSSLSGVTAGSVNAGAGYFDLSGGGTAEVRCYIVRPTVAGAPLAQSTNPLYGMSVCLDVNNAHNPANRLTIVQQIQ